RARVVHPDPSAIGEREHKARALADLSGPDGYPLLVEPGARLPHGGRLLVAALDRARIEPHRLGLVALARAPHRLPYRGQVEGTRPRPGRPPRARAARIASCTTTHMVGAVSTNTHSTPSTMASAIGRSMPRSAVVNGSALERSELQSASEPCGSASIRSVRWPSACECAARCAQIVV